MKFIISVALVWLVSLPTLSAIPNRKQSIDPLLKKLSAPHKIAVSEIYKMGPTAYKKLYKMSFDDSQPMKMRWKAFMVMTSIGGKKSLPEIDRALENKAWFMRSAGLLALENVDQGQARKRARQVLQQDPAMLVRVNAVDILAKDPSKSSRSALWKGLDDELNFHRKRSLWIREHIAKSLAEDPTKRELLSWKRMLHSEDHQLQIHASKALSQLAGKKDIEDPKKQLAYWKKKFPLQR
ncbi:MAG: hypothetical protein KDD33_04465 [Bdellovibrionales bacterium]|nr:hypothetical protein [Bdellovibrionales bacterium]